MPHRSNTGDTVDMSFKINVTRLSPGGLSLHCRATADERAALALRLDIPAVERWEADLVVTPWRGDGVKVEGKLLVDVVQNCVVTLEPVHQRIDDAVDLVFVPEGSRLVRIPEASPGELQLDPEGADIPETFSGDKIDLDDTLSELVGLALDPYPRSPGIVFDELDTDPDPAGGIVSPFAGLRNLRPTDD